MKKVMAIVLTVLFCCASFLVKAQEITGIWFNDVKDAKIEIFKAKNGKYYGKIVWLKEPNRDGKPKVDFRNSKVDLRSRPLLGMNVLTGFVKEGATYEDGEIYDPKNGKSYSCKITPDGANALKIRGYIGISLIGRTTVWTKSSL